MKLLKIMLAALICFLVIFGLGGQLTSCQKTTTQHDTTTVIKVDTVIKKDTLTLIDSLFELKDGLVAYYNFNNGNLNDSSGNGNGIKFNTAGLTADRFGRLNNAYLFDGSSSYMAVPNSPSLNPNGAISLMARIKFNTFNTLNCGGNQILAKSIDDNGSGYYALWAATTVGCNVTVDTSKEVIYGAYGDPSSRPGAEAPDFLHTNQWYTVVYTFEKGESNFYLNGVRRNTALLQLGFTPNSDSLYIGRIGSATNPYFFNGVIDEIRIYNKALDADEVKLLTNLTE